MSETLENVKKTTQIGFKSAIMRIHFNSYLELGHFLKLLKSLDNLFHYTFIFEKRFRRALENLSDFKVEQDDNIFSGQRKKKIIFGSITDEDIEKYILPDESLYLVGANMKKSGFIEIIGYGEIMKLMEKYLINAFEKGEFQVNEEDDPMLLISDFEKEIKLDNIFRVKMEKLKEKGFKEDELREVIKNILECKEKFLYEISKPPVSKVEIITKDEKKTINIRTGE